MEIGQELQVVSRTGKYVLGYRESLLAALNRRAKLLIVAKNCPETFAKEAKIVSNISGTPLLLTEYTREDLAGSLRKPFAASIMAILDPGSSNILEAVGGEEFE